MYKLKRGFSTLACVGVLLRNPHSVLFQVYKLDERVARLRVAREKAEAEAAEAQERDAQQAEPTPLGPGASRAREGGTEAGKTTFGRHCTITTTLAVSPSTEPFVPSSLRAFGCRFGPVGVGG